MLIIIFRIPCVFVDDLRKCLFQISTKETLVKEEKKKEVEIVANEFPFISLRDETRPIVNRAQGPAIKERRSGRELRHSFPFRHEIQNTGGIIPSRL
ncbi:MAG: hypothetical protein PHX78_07250 [bacterium]|nr:hypothetical protein [bacterium]